MLLLGVFIVVGLRGKSVREGVDERDERDVVFIDPDITDFGDCQTSTLPFSIFVSSSLLGILLLVMTHRSARRLRIVQPFENTTSKYPCAPRDTKPCIPLNFPAITCTRCDIKLSPRFRGVPRVCILLC